MFTSKQWTYLKYQYSGPENHISSELIICNIDNPLKSRA